MRVYTIVVSIIAHVAMLIVLVAVPLVAMDALPMARRVTEFVRASAAELPQLPPPPRGGNPPSARDVTPAAAPSVAPDQITAEAAPPNVGPVGAIDGPGVAGGMPDGIPLPDMPIAAPPAPKASAPLRPGGEIKPPRKIKDVTPIYPSIARSSGIQGIVILEAVIGENGRVRNVRVLRSITLLDQAAIDAVRQWQFTPTLLNGQPVPIVLTVTVGFELR